MAPLTPSVYRQTLVYLAARLGEIPHTRLHKLVYLIDLEHYLRHGQTLTNAPWVREKYGPMSTALLPALKDLDGFELRELRTKRGLNTTKLLTVGPAPRFEPHLDKHQLATIDFVLDLTRNLSDQQVRGLAYETTPMKTLLAREREAGHEMIPTPIVFENLTQPAQPSSFVDHQDAAGYRAFKQGEVARVADLVERSLSDFG